GVRVAAARGEVVLGAAQVADAFFTRCGDELDRSPCFYSGAVDLRGQGEHDGQTSAVVVDPRSDETFAVAFDREVGAARKDGVEVRTDHDRRQVRCASAPTDDVPGGIGVHLGQPAIVEAARDPTG